MPTKYNVFTNNLDLVNAVSSLVTGPGVSTDTAIARFNGTTGKIIQNSGVLISAVDAVTGIASIALDLGATIDEFSTDGTLAGNSDTAVPTEKAVKTYVTANAGGGGPREFYYDAAALHATETNFAPLEQLSGSTVKTFIRSFDDTTEEYANGKFVLPGNLDTAGTVTFRTYVMAKTAVAAKNVALTFGHLAVNDSEGYDQAYTDVDSGDKAIDATQNDVTEITWTATVSALGWAASDLVFFRVSRDPAAGSDLSDDMYMFSFQVEAPRA